MTEEPVEEAKSYVQIQVMNNGIWRNVSYTTNNSQYIQRAMGSVQNMYPKARIRAVDQKGKVVDILTK